MREWRRVVVDTRCGYCGATIPKGEPARFTAIATIKRQRIRCANCAGEAPPDLPALIERLRDISAAFQQVSAALPNRTRGALKTLVADSITHREEWMPYRDEP
jgi:hypothetical protein